MNIKDIDKLFEEVAKGNLQYLKDYVNADGDINVKDNEGKAIGDYVSNNNYQFGLLVKKTLGGDNLNFIKDYIKNGGDING